eukprot:TRINITY_DN3794_c0_g1_i1.p1 TRINITY_DN3794_c0_g1~~TRINITY_DN3794_c0_g1_i1.p1  ORF type:complete len:548 (+),score=128.28 TRINITY_DN3794_c0_g1_i1:67-1710(+)
MKLLLLVLLGALCGAALSIPFPNLSNQYTVRGYYSLPYFNTTEYFVFTYDAPNNRAKWDFFDGMDVTYYLYNQKVVYKLEPEIDHQVCNTLTPDNADFPTLTSLFPDLTNNWQYQGVKTVRGILCNGWVQQVTNEFGHTDYYYFYVDAKWNIPVQLYMNGLNYLFGSHQDHYVFDFINYVPSINSNDFTVPSLCQATQVKNVLSSNINEEKNVKVAKPHKKAITAAEAKSVVHQLEEVRLKSAFQRFQSEHGKSYASPAEAAHRYRAYKTNFKFVEVHNQKGAPFTMKINKFGDLTDEEFKKRHLIKRPKTLPEAAKRSVVKHVSKGKVADQIDWRAQGAVSMVKDQASCGSCWTFGATGALEGAYFLSSGQLVSLSEQQIVDCSRSTYGNHGCDGGDASGAYQWIIDNGGIATEQSYPYLGQDAYCRNADRSSGVQVRAYVNVTSSEDGLKDALNVGPVAVAIDASQPSFRFYSSGVYFEPKCKNDANDLDHEVLSVGYGNLNGQDYWIVKNSWSTQWGDQGYIKMARNKGNNCGIATSAVYPVVK